MPAMPIPIPCCQLLALRETTQGFSLSSTDSAALVLQKAFIAHLASCLSSSQLPDCPAFKMLSVLIGLIVLGLSTYWLYITATARKVPAKTKPYPIAARVRKTGSRNRSPRRRNLQHGAPTRAPFLAITVLICLRRYFE